MSEYQYYEFRSIDRPLDKDEMDKLRDLSTRAEITPTSFTNSYRGQPKPGFANFALDTNPRPA